MLDLNFSIATIATFVGILDQITKTIFNTYGKKDWDKFIPICSLIFGLILGISGYFIPNVEMGSNIVEAIFIGLSAGAASTGIHQIYHQQTKDDSKDEPKPEASIAEETPTEETTETQESIVIEEETIVNESTTEEENKEE